MGAALRYTQIIPTGNKVHPAETRSSMEDHSKVTGTEDIASHVWRNGANDVHLYFTSDELQVVEITLSVFEALLSDAGWRPLSEEERIRTADDDSSTGLERLRAVAEGLPT